MAETATTSAGKSDDKVLAAVATLPVIGLIMLFAMKDASPIVKHYARQSNGLLVLSVGLGVVSTVLTAITMGLFGCLAPIIMMLPLIPQVLLIIKAYNGEEKYMLPVIGPMADKWFANA
jgi:uncharacterized membrane protein